MTTRVIEQRDTGSFAALSDGALVYDAAVSAAKELGITMTLLATICQFRSRDALNKRRERARVLDAVQDRFALIFLRIVRSLGGIFGANNIQQQKEWLHGENRTLGVPMQRMQTVEGMVHVADYLDALRGH
jgi:hypothetical protein